MHRMKKEGHGSITFFGALHFGSSAMYPLPEQLQNAFDNAKYVAFETNLAELASFAFNEQMDRLGKQPHGKTLSQEILPETWERLAATAARLGLSATYLETLKPWYCASLLTSTALTETGLNSYLGIDAYLYRAAETNAKSIICLETTQHQLELLTHINKNNTDDFIKQTLQEVDDMPGFSSKMLNAWLNADEEGLAELIADGFADNDSLQASLLAERNKIWFDKLNGSTAHNNQTLVIVGAGHLVGANSLINVFKQHGYLEDETP